MLGDAHTKNIKVSAENFHLLLVGMSSGSVSAIQRSLKFFSAFYPVGEVQLRCVLELEVPSDAFLRITWSPFGQAL